MTERRQNCRRADQPKNKVTRMRQETDKVLRWIWEVTHYSPIILCSHNKALVKEGLHKKCHVLRSALWPLVICSFLHWDHIHLLFVQERQQGFPQINDAWCVLWLHILLKGKCQEEADVSITWKCIRLSGITPGWVLFLISCSVDRMPITCWSVVLIWEDDCQSTGLFLD